MSRWVVLVMLCGCLPPRDNVFDPMGPCGDGVPCNCPSGSILSVTGRRCVGPCSGDEYEVSPPTATADRVCAPVTVCGDDGYEVVAPTATTDRQCAAYAKEVFNGVEIAFSVAPAGSFQMGSDSSDAYSWEKPVHSVTISRPFWIARTEVTQAQFIAVMGVDNPSYIAGSDRPVENVSWDDAVAFCRKLSDLKSLPSAFDASDNVVLSSTGYRLPTEAEWEYAARAGSTGDRYGDVDDIAWYSENSGSQTHDVGGKAPNAWGLFDMLGNVWEWTADWYGAYDAAAVTDPTGPTGGSDRVVRGGSWSSDARDARASYRGVSVPGYRDSHLGFRPARSLP